MTIKMSEILDLPPAWAICTADVQVEMGQVYVHEMWVLGNAGDQVKIYDGVGTTGKVFTYMIHAADDTEHVPVGLLFHDGLYVDLDSSTDRVIVRYTPLPR